jgi:lysophospholipase L1-like esterase
VDAVVVMCGLNDWKRVATGTKFPSAFHADLRTLTAALHGRLGDECRVVLPALPLFWTTAFPQPLFSVVLALANAWDAQKQRLADEGGTAAVGHGAATAAAQQPSPGLLGGPSSAAASSAAEQPRRPPPLPRSHRAVDFVSCPPDLGGPWNVAADGVHPNEDGYAIWAEHIARHLASKLKRLPSTEGSTAGRNSPASALVPASPLAK